MSENKDAESVDDFLSRGGAISQVQTGRSNLVMGYPAGQHSELQEAGKKGGKTTQRNRAGNASDRT